MKAIENYGIATVEEIIFETGHFDADIWPMFHDMIERRWLAYVDSAPELNFCNTGAGLEAIYVYDAFVEASRSIARRRLLKIDGWKLRQRHHL